MALTDISIWMSITGVIQCRINSSSALTVYTMQQYGHAAAKNPTTQIPRRFSQELLTSWSNVQ